MFKWLTKLFTKNKPKGFDFSNEDRQKALEVRLRNRALKLKEEELDRLEAKIKERRLDDELEAVRAQVDSYDDDDEDTDTEDGDDADDLLVKILNPLIEKYAESKTLTPQATNPPASISSESIELSEEQIKDAIDSFPQWKVDIFKSLPIDQQRTQIKKYLPQMSDKSVEKAIEVLHHG